MKQTISVLVENQAGALNRITGLFSRKMRRYFRELEEAPPPDMV